MSDFTGHTPGPWEFDEGNMGSCYSKPYYGIITNSHYSVYIHVGAIADDHRGNRGREDECIANARLIAAAPELLAERDRLRQALANLERTAGIPTMYDDPVRVEARKALHDTGNE